MRKGMSAFEAIVSIAPTCILLLGAEFRAGGEPGPMTVFDFGASSEPEDGSLGTQSTLTNKSIRAMTIYSCASEGHPWPSGLCFPPLRLHPPAPALAPQHKEDKHSLQTLRLRRGAGSTGKGCHLPLEAALASMQPVTMGPRSSTQEIRDNSSLDTKMEATTQSCSNKLLRPGKSAKKLNGFLTGEKTIRIMDKLCSILHSLGNSAPPCYK
ncbi:hypothetical protein JZ751_003832 [Albula glossodonta]|uniref:Uncharacterized protein n=1 Tax=Albula glossodonta TaxID=121402 RepID=A0A8T2P7Z7_9TELE|nr:hypothetical protein JZ751_003832 [Albula glossodonta]